MLVSIILPVYNAELFLEVALESVLSQSHEDFELIAIDDGSTDSSLQILKRLSVNNKRVRVFSQNNQGLVNTLNRGICLANGDLVARMDADDICDPKRLECQVRFMSENPDVVCVGSQIQLIDPVGRDLMQMRMPLNHEDIDEANCSCVTGIVHPTSLIRLSALKLVGGYRGAYTHAEDIDLWLRLAEIGRLANLPMSLLRYRQHLNSVGYKYGFEQKCAQWKAVKDAYQRRGKVFLIARPSMGELQKKIPLESIEEKWAWWALKSGNVRTARYYAMRALAIAPWRLSVWKLALCCVRGR